MNDSGGPARSLAGGELHKRYREGLPARIGTLETALAALDEDGGAEEVIRRMAHVLRGSGASYGYPEVTSTAARTEEADRVDLRGACEALLEVLRGVAGATGDEDQPVILVIEHDPELRHLLEVVLAGQGREVVAADSGASAIAVMDARPVQVVVLDLLLPRMDGRSLLRSIRSRESTSHAPVIVLSAHDSAKVQTECFALGADAFFKKPFDPEVLEAAVNAHLSKTVEQESEARTDPVTGLLNRSGLLEAFRALSPDAERVLAIVELDDFDRVEGRHGWALAESALRSTGRAIERVAREGEGWAGRWEGETFLLVLLGGVVSARPRVEKAVEAVRLVPVKGPDGETFRVTASAGMAAGTGSDAPEELLDLARGGVYRARESGGNRLAQADSGERRTRRVLVAEDDDLTASLLLHRLGREGFEVEWHSNGADAYEAALRARPDLAVLDVRMPGMDGFEVLERLRKVPAFHDVPIVLLTSQGSDADFVRGFRLGADDYVLKPFSPTEFLARVRRLVSRRS